MEASKLLQCIITEKRTHYDETMKQKRAKDR